MEGFMNSFLFKPVMDSHKNMKDKVSAFCVGRCLTCNNQSRPVTMEQKVKLVRSEISMIRWTQVCCETAKCTELLGLEPVSLLISTDRLGRFGHAECTDNTDQIKHWTVMELVSKLEFNVPFQQKYGCIRDERSGMESYPYPVKEGQRYINLNPGHLFAAATKKGKWIERLI